ncbi:probable xyloglucan endotransglucosylase/hydrolase protein 27 [Hibiscus syriacus]|uniref:probable xyloglucan endotransglucosylase/hydrolase protein 27 n=1 Tax=Hibiscus syriacus TaxID=106335 RepID=UPI0019214E9E|nr:probable xyloglucan endotransglucosylase/hydrolase protein 27 [Hibiscus syriacus]
MLFVLCRFYVGNIPIREFKRTAAMGGEFPSKPMSLYATIWDGSDWATNGGKYRVNYKYAPYIAKFTGLILHGCMIDPIKFSSKRCYTVQSPEQLTTHITPSQGSKMDSFRRKNMTYSYCYDQTRYNVPPPECVINPLEGERLKKFDPVTFGGGSRHHGKRHQRSRVNRSKAYSI